MVRPLIDIDWEKADELMIAGCNGVQIAGYFGMHPETFYDRVKKEKKIGFTQYLQQKQSKGEALIVAQQYAKALGLTDSGDNTLLIWLGKTRLEQKERPLELEHSLTVNTIDYSNAENHNPPSQIPTEKLSDTSSESS